MDALAVFHRVQADRHGERELNQMFLILEFQLEPPVARVFGGFSLDPGDFYQVGGERTQDIGRKIQLVVPCLTQEVVNLRALGGGSDADFPGLILEGVSEQGAQDAADGVGGGEGLFKS